MANTQISNNDSPSVQISNDQIVTTSTDIAKCFGKHHKNVLRKIESLECSEEFHKLNFELMENEVEIGLGKTRKEPMYRITRDGFVFLAMGFTGAKAAQFKEAYIKAFNQMETKLHEQKYLPATAVTTHETNFQEKEKYQVLNDMIKSMKLQSDPVVMPSKELVDMIHAIRMYQTQIAQLSTPDWVNDNVDRVKDYAKRNFTDF
jgi:Rha family phage regulatory protein